MTFVIARLQLFWDRCDELLFLLFWLKTNTQMLDKHGIRNMGNIMGVGGVSIQTSFTL
jgi:hypothetical protein